MTQPPTNVSGVPGRSASDDKMHLGCVFPGNCTPPVVSSVRNSSLQLTWVSHYETTWNGVFPEISGEKSRTLRVWRVSGGRQGTDEHAIHRSRSSVVCGFVCCLRRCLMFQVLKYFRTQKKKTGTSPGFVRTGGPLCPPPTLYISSSPVSLCNKNCLRTRSSEPKNFLPKPWLLPCAFM